MRNGEMHFLPLPRAISTLSECNNSGSFIASRLAQCLHAVCSLRGKPRGKVWIIGEKEWVMNQDSATKQSPRITWMLGGLAFGVVAMYLSDPERGRRRRGLAIDKMRSAVIRTGDTLDMVSRDLGDRVQGLRVRTSNMLSRRNIAPVDDRILMARVRQKIGRAVSNPHAIEITARQGCIILSGPVLAHERQQLLDTVRRVHGVSKLEDRLQIHEQADGIASLQGSAKLGGSAAQGSRTPALRIVALIGATTLGMLGGMRRRPANLILAATGLALMMRSISNMPFKRSADIAASRRVMDLHKTIHIEATPEAVFDLWRKYENFPRFMSHVREVRDLGYGRSHWIVRGPAGVQFEWNAAITEVRRPEMLAWRSEPASAIQHRGMVHFAPDGNGTRVTVHMSYGPPADALGHAIALMFNGDPKRQMDEDLRRMKVFIETGNVSYDTAQSGPQTSATLH